MMVPPPTLRQVARGEVGTEFFFRAGYDCEESHALHEAGTKPASCNRRLFYFNPATAAPVAMPTPRFAPAIALALSPTPIIWHDTQPQGRLIPGLTANTPTIAFVVTDDSG